MPTNTEILTTKQVAERFAVHPQTVIDWANSGRLACFRTAGGHRRYHMSDVNALLEDGRNTNAEDVA